jgi:hypothetical protein
MATAYSLRNATISIEDSDSPANSVDISGPSVSGSYLQEAEITIQRGQELERVKDRGTMTDVVMPADSAMYSQTLTLARVAGDDVAADALTIFRGGLPSGWVAPLKLKVVMTAGSNTRTITLSGVSFSRTSEKLGPVAALEATMQYASDATYTDVVS